MTQCQHPLGCQNISWVDIAILHCNVSHERPAYGTLSLFQRDFAVWRWFCSLGVHYITSRIPAAKTRSHFSIVPWEKKLRGRWQAAVRAAAPGKLGLYNFTEFHKRHHKALFIIGSILGVLKPTSLRYTVWTTPGTGFILLSQSTSLLYLDWPVERQKNTEVTYFTVGFTGLVFETATWAPTLEPFPDAYALVSECGALSAMYLHWKCIPVKICQRASKASKWFNIFISKISWTIDWHAF